MLNRRGFLAGILSVAVAPAIVKAEILMPVRKIILPDWRWGGYEIGGYTADGIHPTDFTWHQEKIIIRTSDSLLQPTAADIEAHMQNLWRQLAKA